MLNGENARAIREEREWNAAAVIDTDEYDEYDSDSDRDGLHRELFLHIEDKSTEGLLCAVCSVH